MMKLGFVSAILPDASLESVFQSAAAVGYDCVELMCWPQGKAERRYAGVTHVDAAALCLLYTSPSPRDATLSRMPSSA